MKQKINIRLALIALIAVLATTTGVTLIYYNLFQNRVKSDLKTHAQILADTGYFQRIFKDAEGDPEHIDYQTLSQMKAENLRITWINPDGDVLFDNDTDPEELPNHLDRPEILSALKNGSGESVRNSDTFNMDTFYYALKLDDGTILRVSTRARSIANVFMASAPFTVLIVAAIFALCIMIGHHLTIRLIQPINTMAEHLDENIDIPIYPELEPFAKKIRSQHDKILEAAISRQDFTANVSHELKTPLTAISGYAELIENEMVDADSQIHIAKQIRSNADRLLSLINDIIRLNELDHNETGQIKESFNLYKLAEDCCKGLRVNADKHSVSLSCTGTDTMLIGDRELLKELLENLIQNAIRYNVDAGWVKVKVSSENGHALLTVSDGGIGIPKDQQERIFERFYRVDKSRSRETGGTGLGLSIVKHIAEIHNAKIDIDSEIGRGTDIIVRF